MPGHSRVTQSRHRPALGGHLRTPGKWKSSSAGPWRRREDGRGHDTTTVRDREAPGSNPGPPTIFAGGDPVSKGRAGRAALGREIRRKLQAIHDVGLEYLTLGQPLSTLSGGECQRIKLASELHKHGSIYVLDEPTTGLHMSDIGNLLVILNRLVDGGNTVIVIEHNMDVVRNTDWIVDLGPEGGSKGGRVVFEGTPRQILDAPGSLTGQYLARPVPHGSVTT